MQTNKTGVNGADPAENQTPSYSAEVELEGNEVNPWPYIHTLLCSVSFPVAQLVEHGASNAKVMGLIPRESKS